MSVCSDLVQNAVLSSDIFTEKYRRSVVWVNEGRSESVIDTTLIIEKLGFKRKTFIFLNETYFLAHLSYHSMYVKKCHKKGEREK